MLRQEGDKLGGSWCWQEGSCRRVLGRACLMPPHETTGTGTRLWMNGGDDRRIGEGGLHDRIESYEVVLG